MQCFFGELQEVAQKVAMHAVAMKPQYLNPESVPAQALEGQSSSSWPAFTNC